MDLLDLLDAPATAPAPAPPPRHVPPPHLLDVRRIYVQPAAEALPRGREVLARFPDAERVPVASHWNIPELNGEGGDPEDWLRTKRETLVLGVKSSLACRPNGRSADFIAPSTSNGCAMACAYCYVARRKGHANPITVFANVEQVAGFLRRHAARQGAKRVPDQVDASAWVYDIGENGDLCLDAAVSDNPRDLVAAFRDLPNAKASFATKYVNPDLLGWDHGGRTRVRVSLMPERPARVLDVRTSPIPERVAFAGDLARAGYEVHLNFSPVVVYDGWEADWAALFERLDDELPPEAKRDVACEVIMLTHNADLHEVNLAWHPKAEDLLWRPDLQEEKVSEGGGLNVRYRHGEKARLLRRFRDLLAARMPYCRVRYAF